MRNFTTLAKRALLGTSISMSLGLPAFAASTTTDTEVTGAGSTFVNPILMRWSAAYNEKYGVKVYYQSIGSTGGLAQIKKKFVDFGASDIPMNARELAAFGLGQFPFVIGGVVPVINVPHAQPGQLKFTGALLADIFLGKVTMWNDPEIAAVNTGVNLPALHIVVVHRSDGSGTTFNWTNYLTKVSLAWKVRIGEGASVAWPVGLGAKGSEGVTAYVKQVPGAIGYVEYAYAVQGKLGYGLVQNREGRFIAPNAASFQAAAETAGWSTAKDFNLVITDAPGANAYPITATTFIIMRKKPNDAPRTKTVCDFFQWSLNYGQPQAMALDYAPLSPALVQQVKAYWARNF
ncbi:phosphate ABC transporter substrate-binding protein PstS [Dyella psychrodurans]|uniref:Phosphate-binding protein PstS n=1 Tax=Dyella psychrodurans TaxID=1927960 RepID=A0A370WXV6_9GAMM|nr:phosphate ABC transporter substrate-binding protein PstS [Dyella psychrodurans]RDS80978.1 phosphate ABC transporter substrate-binding protein PstS [Dyella psychrodurans]